MMRILLAPLLLAASLPAMTEGNPNTYKECVKNASDINSKWIEYRTDVNKCRAILDISGKY